MDIGLEVAKVIRDMLWGITKVFLWVLDTIFKVVKLVVAIDISKFSFIFNWLSILFLFLSFFMALKFFSMYIKAMGNDEYAERIEPTKVILRIAIAGCIVTFTPILYSHFCGFSSALIENVGVFIGSDSDNFNPSDIIVSAGNINFDDNSILEYEIASYKDIDINERITNEAGKKVFKYFPTYGNIFFLIFIAIAGSYLFVLIAIQIAMRIWDLGKKLFLAPYAIPTIIDPDDRTFMTWIKYIAADLITNFYQYYTIFFVLTVCASSTLNTLLGDGIIAILAKIIFFLAGLVSVLNGATGVAAIIGGDGMAASTALQGLSTLKSASGALRTAGNMTSGVAALATYAGGRLMGGKSTLNASQSTGANANFGSGKSNFNSGFGNSSSSGGSGKNSAAFNKDPTEKQEQAAAYAGISTEGKSRGQVSQELEQAGHDSSWFNSSNGGSFNTLDSDSSTTSTSSESSTIGGATEATGVAGKIRDYGSSHSGVTGISARALSTAAKGIYGASEKRLARSKGFNRASNIASTIKKDIMQNNKKG